MSRYYLSIVLIAVILVLGWAANHYYDKAVAWRTTAQHAQELIRQQAATITDMQTHQRNVAALDERYTKELADAKATINQLHDDVATGKRRLQLNAICEKQSASRTTGMDDAASARLTDAAQRAYFTLRERIEVAGKQIAGLQQYIREQCLK
ncbi:lysis protein [Pantoea agglomerans]|uniref:lysis protein n=1 Tax=Enterobacter agglomerans TaxID=549 RepID=UPI00187889AD|nr:lysis protein [Pantoea agglomerans]MBE5683869.1 lysis protein [Pantoea agglomerans]